MPAPDTGALRSRLRSATAERHREVDAVVAERPFASMAAYTGFLVAHRRARLRVAERFGGLAPDARWAARLDAQAHALAADLRALGVEAPDGQRGGVSADPSDGWGITYVLVGSMLGGRVLARRLEAELGPGAPAGYLGTGASMRALADDLERCAEPDAAVAAALGCFDVYCEVMSEPFVLRSPSGGLYP